MKSSFVFDTNSLISAVLSPGSTNPAAIRKAEEFGEIVCSDETWKEFVSVLFRPKFDRYFSVGVRSEIATRMANRLRRVIAKAGITDCKDPKDNMFLDLATACDAVCIISGDIDLLEMNPYRGIPVVTARVFIDQFSA